MRLCVGALKEFINKAGRPVQRPLDHAGANDLGVPPPPVIMCRHTVSGKCSANHTRRTEHGIQPGHARSLKDVHRMGRRRKTGVCRALTFIGRTDTSAT